MVDDASPVWELLGSGLGGSSGIWAMAFSFAPYRGLFIFSPLTHGSRRGLYSFAASRLGRSRAIFAERIEFRPDCCRDEMSVLRFETGVEAPSCFRDAPWALGAWRFEYRSRAYHNAAWEFLKFGDSGFAPQPSSLATTTGAELCSACRGLRAAPTHDYSDAVDSFLPLR